MGLRKLVPMALTGFTMVVACPVIAAEQAARASVTAELGLDGVQRATLILDSYSYTPAHLIVQAGKPVELTLRSVTTLVPHNFILRDPALGLDIQKDVAAGKTEIVSFTPTRPGTVTFYCDRRLWPLPSHRDKGMEGTLDIR
jgi:plastocyanin